MKKATAVARRRVEQAKSRNPLFPRHYLREEMRKIVREQLGAHEDQAGLRAALSDRDEQQSEADRDMDDVGVSRGR